MIHNFLKKTMCWGEGSSIFLCFGSSGSPTLKVNQYHNMERNFIQVRSFWSYPTLHVYQLLHFEVTILFICWVCVVILINK